MKNNIFTLVFVVSVLVSVLSACGGSQDSEGTAPVEVEASQTLDIDEGTTLEHVGTPPSGVEEGPTLDFYQALTATFEVAGTTPGRQEEKPASNSDQGSTMSAPDQNPKIENHYIEFEGQQRKYMVFLPKNYPGDTSYPLVIYLHAYDRTSTEGMNYTSLNHAAETHNFIVAYPSALPNWNSGIGDDPNWPTPNNNDVGFITILIDAIINQYGVDPDRVYALGLSNGGFMAYKLACQPNNRIAAIASVAGVFSTSTAENCNPGHPMPILQIHGTDDGYIPIEGGTGKYSVNQTLEYWIDINKCTSSDMTTLADTNTQDGSTVDKYSYTNCDNNGNVIYYKVLNGGHSWPGAYAPGYSENTNLDFEAGHEILMFFKDHQQTSTAE